MKKQTPKRLRLTRPADAFLPAALLLSSLLGREREAAALFMMTFLVEVCSLVSAHGVRTAFATQPSFRKVRGSVVCALLTQIVAAAIAAGIILWTRETPDVLPWLGLGWLLNIEHTFYEYLYAVGDQRSAGLSRGLTALLTLTGLMLTERGAAFSGALENLRAMTWLYVGVGLPTLIAIIIGVTAGDGLKATPYPFIVKGGFRFALALLVQEALLPAMAVAAGVFLPRLLPRVAWPPLGLYAGGFAALMIYELCRTPFRRSHMEARGMNAVLLGILLASAALFAGCCAYPAMFVEAPLNGVPGFSAMLAVGALAALVMYGNFVRAKD